MGDQADLAAALSAVSFSSRKPELPAFDKKNVDIWIRRVENAFIRANVTLPRDKFAYIESKFSVSEDPKINLFLYGDTSADNWDAFIAYLKKCYGKSIRDRAAAVLDHVPRNGRRPSQHVAYMKEQAANITLDELLKEKMLRELPADIRLTVTTAVKNLTLEEAVDVADDFFEKDGRPIHRSSASVNAVQPSASCEDTGDTDVNAIRNGARPKQRNDARSRSKSRPRTNGAGYVHKNPDLCYYHDRYGDKARNCQPGCKSGKAPNAQGPRRA